MASYLSTKAMEYIQRELQDRGLSVNALAKSMDKPQTTLNRIVTGGSDVSFEMLYDMCKALDINMRDVIDYVELPAKKKKRIVK